MRCCARVRGRIHAVPRWRRAQQRRRLLRVGCAGVVNGRECSMHQRGAAGSGRGQSRSGGGDISIVVAAAAAGAGDAEMQRLTYEALDAWAHGQAARLYQGVENVCLELMQLLEEGLALGRVCGRGTAQARPLLAGTRQRQCQAARGCRDAPLPSQRGRCCQPPVSQACLHPRHPRPPTRHADPGLPLRAAAEVMVHTLLAAPNLQQHAVLLQAPGVVQPLPLERLVESHAVSLRLCVHQHLRHKNIGSVCWGPSETVGLMCTCRPQIPTHAVAIEEQGLGPVDVAQGLHPHGAPGPPCSACRCCRPLAAPHRQRQLLPRCAAGEHMSSQVRGWPLAARHNCAGLDRHCSTHSHSRGAGWRHQSVPVVVRKAWRKAGREIRHQFDRNWPPFFRRPASSEIAIVLIRCNRPFYLFYALHTRISACHRPSRSTAGAAAPPFLLSSAALLLASP